MADNPKSLLDQPARGAFAEGAARFERLIQSVKVQQADNGPSPAALPDNPLLAVSPEEEWSRQFRSVGIGPERRGLSPSDLAPLPRAMALPEFVAPKPAVAAAPTAELAPKPAAIGAGMGKSEPPRRSWLGRMLQRS